ncbi:exported hypothetical protein [Gammaproteobacteria bacterium]
MHLSTRLILPSLVLLMDPISIALGDDPATNLYVLAYVPAGAKTPVCSPRTKLSAPSWWVENPDHAWTRLMWPPMAFQSNITGVPTDLTINCDMTEQTGTTIWVGIGASADEMLAALRIEAIYRVPPESHTNPANPFPVSDRDAFGISEAMRLEALNSLPCETHCELMVINDGDGTVTSSLPAIDCGVKMDCDKTFPFNTRVTLTASPDAGYHFERWGGACLGTTTATCELVMNVRRGVAVTFCADDGGCVDTAVVTLITYYYQSILGRAPEPAGLTYYQERMTQAKARGDVKPEFKLMAYNFLNSPEYLNRATNNDEYIATLYKTFLQRDPEGAGLQYYLDLLAAGATRNSLLDNFVNSPEFGNFMKNLGL